MEKELFNQNDLNGFFLFFFFFFFFKLRSQVLNRFVQLKTLAKIVYDFNSCFVAGTFF